MEDSGHKYLDTGKELVYTTWCNGDRGILDGLVGRVSSIHHFSKVRVGVLGRAVSVALLYYAVCSPFCGRNNGHVSMPRDQHVLESRIPLNFSEPHAAYYIYCGMNGGLRVLCARVQRKSSSQGGAKKHYTS